MKENNLEMAWEAPKDGQNQSGGNQSNPQKPQDQNGHNGSNNPNDPNNRNNQNGSAPDLDEIFKKLGGAFRGRGGQGHSSGIGKYIAIGGAVLLCGWLATGFYTIDAGQKGVELLLGQYHATKDPGLRWRFPSPIGEHRIIDIQRRFSQKIGSTAKGNRKASMLTKDENLVDVNVEVQYQINNDDPAQYWFASVDPDKTLKEVVDSATRERVGQTSLDDILTDGREQLMQEVKELAQSILDNYAIGLVITNVNLEDAQAPAAVQDAFSDAIRAREDEQSRINQAEAYQSKVHAEARGEAERILREAEAYRESKMAQARGEAERFNRLYTAYRNAPDVTRERLYLENMETVLQNSNKLYMGSDSGNNLMMLPLDKMINSNNSNNTDKGSNSRANSSANNMGVTPINSGVQMSSTPAKTTKAELNNSQKSTTTTPSTTTSDDSRSRARLTR
ncbi:FtsH protease activity modulator HflK [Ignatzschineria ureiclastica]|uniref:Protein HflK n=1 Tax=Ignatzschineria ureiclastica TaxID=472582 RepID=A0A2U2AGX5_9GAMM|nr:FtsH protease activity modulator HflK [Ignatzschineria ureiclastica]PWD81916.1 FtsH protease activity modulator HflK [Ignatzschineria ureiclastica]GGZ91393.1 protease modulator HflK [Ignatzschineria ureiclastica]